MKDIWIITEEDHGFLAAAETPLDAIHWLVRNGWLELDDDDMVSWYDEEKNKYYELSIRESAKKFGVSIEDFLERVLVEGLNECEMRFSLFITFMIEHDDRPLE